jgi:hypothetical protein
MPTLGKAIGPAQGIYGGAAVQNHGLARGILILFGQSKEQFVENCSDCVSVFE